MGKSKVSHGEITSVPEPYILRKPIAIEVRPTRGGYSASELEIGLLTTGEGATRRQATISLRDSILGLYNLYQQEKENFVGYAKLVGQKLEEFIGTKS